MTKTCAYCDRPLFSRGVCAMHWKRAARAGRMDLLEPPQKVGRKSGAAWYGKKNRKEAV